MRDDNYKLKIKIDQKVIDVEHDRDHVNRIAERKFFELEHRHEKAKREAEEQIAILEHASDAARRKGESVLVERDRQANALRSEYHHIMNEEEQAGEAWTRVNDGLQRTNMTSVAQATHLGQRGKAESDKCKAELLVMIEAYNRAVDA